MDKKNLILLKTLLLSTSRVNVLKHSKDKKKKRKIVAAYVGLFFLYAMIMAYSILMCVGYGMMGIIDSVPAMCALVISSLGFVFTVFKTNGYLFNFKEYDMLMSLPFESSTIAGCKFLYMYIKTLPWYMSVSVAMLIGYAIFAGAGPVIWLYWILLSLFIPLIPMLAASFVGFIIAKISSGFKKTNLIQTILAFVFIIFSFSLRYIIETFFENGRAGQTLENMSQATEKASGIYLPMGWFSDAVTKGSLLSGLLLIVVSSALFLILFRIVGRSYRNINSALKTHAAGGKFKMTTQKKRSLVTTIAYKEFRRMMGSTTYITNAAVGEVLAVILGVATLIFGFDVIVSKVTSGAPFDSMILQPAIPFIAYFLVGMMSTTSCSPSLEGKNYWIVQSMPIEKKTLYQGKMLFNMCLTVPFMAFTVLCFCISARVPVINALLYIVLGIALCAFSTAWGCVCGIKHMKLDWENEVEVIKQGPGVAWYMLPNMFVVMILVVLIVFLGMRIDHKILALLFTAIAGVLALISYKRALALAERK
ncbi:MAG: hypothetical protein ILA11_01320 [Butyrivibrio sp.]|nr:hypothetical protein [Butyrivibrio sp.]